MKKQYVSCEGHWALGIVDCGEKFFNHWLKKAIDIEEEK